MDEKTKEALAKALTMLVDSLEQGKEFVIEQAPLLVQEIIAFGRAKHTATFVGCIALGVVLYFVARRVIRWTVAKFAEDRYSDAAFTAMLLGSIGGIVSSIALATGACTSFSPMLEAWFAP